LMSSRRSSSRKRHGVKRLTFERLGGEVVDNVQGYARNSARAVSKAKDTSIVVSYLLVLAMVLTGISIHWLNTKDVSVLVVWAYAWITAVSTGIGATPFLVLQHINRMWMGLSNCAAAGMMIAASVGLITEGIILDSSARRSEDFYHTFGLGSTLVGFLVGNVFMIKAKLFLDKHEESGAELYSIERYFSKRTLLIVFVMTVHSFSEGVAIGVSFAGEGGHKLGSTTATSLAIHNIPEGLAVSLALVPKGASASVAALWSIASSIPQPIMAVVAYMFVDKCTFLLPAGLGFAAGAMLWVSFVELLKEALEEIPARLVLLVTDVASIAMFALQSAHGD